MTPDEIIAKLQEIEQTKSKLVKDILPSVGNLFKPIFDFDPRIASIWFTGYTPHFNDGEPCTFSINPDVYVVYSEYEGMDADELEEGFDYYSHPALEGPSRRTDPLYINVYQRAVEIIESLPYDVWQSLGEGRYIISRDGTLVVDDYDHD